MTTNIGSVTCCRRVLQRLIIIGVTAFGFGWLGGYDAYWPPARMSRRKSEITGHMNERDFPHLVELALPPGGIRDQSLEFNAFHHECGIPIRRGRVRHEVEQFHVRFCFPDAATADAFRERFGGERLTYTPRKPRPRAFEARRFGNVHN